MSRHLLETVFSVLSLAGCLAGFCSCTQEDTSGDSSHAVAAASGGNAGADTSATSKPEDTNTGADAGSTTNANTTRGMSTSDMGGAGGSATDSAGGPSSTGGSGGMQSNVSSMSAGGSAGGSTDGMGGSTASGGVGGSGTSTAGLRNECKRGIAYGHHSKADLAALVPAVAWWYNWHYLPDEALRDGSYASAGVDYVPMVWGKDFDASTITESIPMGAGVLLGFNEPNFGSQANISAQEAAALWPEVERIADARDLLTVSPAVNFCGGDCRETDPFEYLDDFFAACDGCRVDRVAFHIYVGCNPSGDNKAEWLINHVETYKQRFSQPLWLTEFACDNADSFATQVAFLEDAVAYLENDPRIERYAWFSGRFQNMQFVDLLGADGELTPLGEAYVQAPVAPACMEP